MRLTPSDFHIYYRPSECTLRVYLYTHSEPEEPASPYADVIRQLGQRHEKAHLQTFASVSDLSSIALDELESITRQTVAKRAQVIYQPMLRSRLVLNGSSYEVIGRPDFLIYESGNYVIRDSKISRRISGKDHPEIIRQLQLYGWLYRQMFDKPPVRLEVHSGTNQIIPIPDFGEVEMLQELQQILELKLSNTLPYSPVGWSKCGGCSFHNRCWTEAENKKDVALVAGVDQSLARALHEIGVYSIEDFLGAFDEQRLANFKKPHGSKSQRVGQRAGAILRMAEAMASGKESMLDHPQIPHASNYVMFDLEGLPPQLDEIEKVYLWGMQVFGKQPGPFMAALAGFGSDGDRKGWFDFLDKADNIFCTHGDLPFVHWHHYERTKIDMYLQRYGDQNGIATRVRNNLLDLLPITRDSIALPLPSYSLKVIEKYVGYKRTQDEYGGDWAMAKYIEATETENQDLRNQVMEQIMTYNHEDLEATWAVFKWLKQKAV